MARDDASCALSSEHTTGHFQLGLSADPLVVNSDPQAVAFALDRVEAVFANGVRMRDGSHPESLEVRRVRVGLESGVTGADPGATMRPELTTTELNAQ